MTQIKSLLKIEETGSHKRAAFSSFMLFSILLVFAIFSTNTIMMYKTGGPTVSSTQVQKFLSNFYRQKPAEINLPASPYILGDPDAPVTLSVFTDYLCSACYGFYKVEKYLLAKYKGKIRIVYYHYPLDSVCNQDVSQSVYKNSCVASRAMHAAVETGIYSEYLVEHFNNYKEMKKDYTEEWSTQILADLRKKGTVDVEETAFKRAMYSDRATAAIEGQVNAAIELKVDATPTIIIAGRTLRGVPPKEMMSALIDNELRKQ